MATTKREINTITVYARQEGSGWVVTSPDAPGIVGRHPVRGSLGNGSGFEKALDQWRDAYVKDAKESGGGIASLKAALKQPALRTRFLPGDVVEIVLSTGGSNE